MTALIVVIAAVSFYIINKLLIDYTIVSNDESYNLKTFNTDVKEVLKKVDILYDDDDIIEVSEKEDGKTKVVHTIAFPIEIQEDSKTETFKLREDTAVSFLSEKGILLSNEEVKQMALDSQDGIYYKIQKETNEIPFEEISIPNKLFLKGMNVKISDGQTGEEQIVTLSKINDEISNKKILDREITKTPVPSLYHYGTANERFRSIYRSGGHGKFSSYLDVEATAYTYTSTGGTITASGKKVAVGNVAVDPKVIPLGTKMFITSADGSFVYGYAVAADTGGAIKGNKIDIFLPTEEDCINFGRRPLRVYFLR